VTSEADPEGAKAHSTLIDARVGRRLKSAREARALTQTQLATAVGLVFQNIQKYESGAVRISAGRLYQFAKILRTPLSYFYADSQDEITSSVDIDLCVEMARLSELRQRAIREFLRLSESHAAALSDIAGCLNQRRS